MFNSKLKNELARRLRSFAYERTGNGVFFPKANITFGGVFGYRIDDGEMRYVPALSYADNAVTNELVNAILNCYFNNGSPPTGFYVAPFTSSTTPTNALTAATFAATQSEYTSYNETARQAWTSNGASSAQSLSNSNAPAVFTIGTGGATLTGAGVLTASGKGATTGVLVAAALFDTANTLNAGSKLTVEYSLSATAA